MNSRLRVIVIDHRNIAQNMEVPSEYMLSAAEYRDYLDSVESLKSDGAYYDPDVSAGLRLVIKGIEEDEKKNYNEAVRLYREAIRKHLEPSFDRETRDSVKKLIRIKCNQVLDRKYLLTMHSSSITSIPAQSPLVDKCSAFHISRNVIKKAIDEDDNENYEEALRLFRVAKKYFLDSIKPVYNTYVVDRVPDDENPKIKTLKRMDTKIKSLEAILEKEKITHVTGQMSRL